MNRPVKLQVRWIDSGVEPTCESYPLYPDGIDVDMRPSSRKPIASCTTDLPYPAKRCGKLIIECQICGLRVLLSTAGRPDDPRSVTLPCKLH